MTPAERVRIAALTSARDAWRSCAATVRRHAEERAIAWIERHVPERFADAMPYQYPERLLRKYRRQEDHYADRLHRASQHTARADACDVELRRIRAGVAARRPRQHTLF